MKLVICGHVHSQGGMEEKFRNIVITNVSSHDNSGAKGNFVIIELTKEGFVDVEWHDTFEFREKNSVEQLHGIGPKNTEKLKECGVIKIPQLAKYKNLPKLAKLSGISEERLLEFQIKAKSWICKDIYQIAPFKTNYEKKILLDIETSIDPKKKVWLIGLQIDNQFIRLYANN